MNSKDFRNGCKHKMQEGELQTDRMQQQQHKILDVNKLTKL